MVMFGLSRTRNGLLKVDALQCLTTRTRASDRDHVLANHIGLRYCANQSPTLLARQHVLLNTMEWILHILRRALDFNWKDSL
jgi:hypothetical protein